MKILILANHYNTLRIFRRELIIALANAGHDIVISMPSCDEDNKHILESYGTRVIFTDFERRGMNPIKDIKLLSAYKHLIRSEKPDKVITYTIKCNIYGGFACKAFNIPHYANITGLGSMFQNDNFKRKLVSTLYKWSLKKSKKVFFENDGNRDVIVNDGTIKCEQAFVLPGAGVNLDEFAPVPYPEHDRPLYFLFVGRIMQEKGVDEYFDAIRRIKAEHPDTEFHFIGWYEDNYEETVKSMESNGLIHFHGFQADVKPFIENSHCVVLPSWHEGMSNTLLEASAMCRPLITTNIFGCKEAVIEGENGLLTETKNAESLYCAIKQFVEFSQEKRANMGLNGRRLMEKRFDKNEVVRLTINEIF